MKEYRGRHLTITSINGETVEGVCCGATDDIVKILVDGEKDARVVFIRNIFSYVVRGNGVDEAYSGLKLYVCKNDEIGCPGRRRISSTEVELHNMECEALRTSIAKGCPYQCDFGCIGAIEAIPSRVMRILCDGMLKAEKIKTKNTKSGSAS